MCRNFANYFFFLALLHPLITRNFNFWKEFSEGFFTLQKRRRDGISHIHQFLPGRTQCHCGAARDFDSKSDQSNGQQWHNNTVLFNNKIFSLGHTNIADQNLSAAITKFPGPPFVCLRFFFSHLEMHIYFNCFKMLMQGVDIQYRWKNH